MEIYIVGSLRDPVPGEGPPPVRLEQDGSSGLEKGVDRNTLPEMCKFRAAAQALGYAGGKAKATLRVGTVGWKDFAHGQSMAEWVIKGADQAGQEMNKPVKVIFDVPRPSGNPGEDMRLAMNKLDDLQKLPRVDLVPHFLRVTYTGQSLPDDLSESDALILLGGSTGTERLAYGAHLLGKPIVPVRFFGRAAERVYQQMVRDELGDANAEAVGALCAEWKNEISKQDAEPGAANTAPDPEMVKHNRQQADAVLQFAKTLVSEGRQMDRRVKRPLGLALGAMILLLVAWVWLYVTGSQGEGNTAVRFFALLYVSALLGAGLRVLQAYGQPNGLRLTGWSLAIQAVLGLVIAFGLALVYLIGAITFTSQVIVIDSKKAISTPSR